MKFSRHASAILIGLGIMAAAGSSAAWSQEQLVIPYACDARGGGVRLYPAPQQSYRIYGKREKWLFRYCSPNAPDRCHHWMLHQFDVDCGGIRVPWIRVAEASSPDGRAWVEQGRMTLKLGSAEASPREERMARRRWWWRDRGAYPADERERFDGPSGPHSEMVELPAGFAPVLGTRAQFIGAQPDEISSGPAERDSEMAAITPAKPTAPAPPKREGSPAAKPKEAAAPAIKPPAPTPAKRETAKSAEAVPAAEKIAPKPDAAAKSEPALQAKTDKAAAPAPKPEPSSGTSIAPTIINKPQGAAAQPAPAPAAPPHDAGPAAVAEATGDRSASAAPAQVGAATSPVTTTAAEPAAQIAGETEVNSAPADGASPIATGSLREQQASERSPKLFEARTLTIGFVLFGVLAASSFVLWSRRQERAQLGALVRRDIASISFGGEPRPASLPAPLSQHSNQADADSAITQEAAPSETSLEMPATPQEALHVLGASSDASIDVIKKIVDGLRQSWHPDLARSDDDRLYREQRVKQINVAWDILSGRRSAA